MMRSSKRLGTFRYPVQIGPLDGSISETLDALVDTGGTYTWVPRPMLERLGIRAMGRRRLQLADGQIIEREYGHALMTVAGVVSPTICIFGDPDTTVLLGAVTLEECGLAADPVRRELVPVVGLLMMAS